jgi:hypothetical protein
LILRHRNHIGGNQLLPFDHPELNKAEEIKQREFAKRSHELPLEKGKKRQRSSVRGA